MSTFKRYLFLIIGLLINAMGIVLITKSQMGTSPIASIPYVFSKAFPISMGAFTFLLYLIMFLVQLLLLGREIRKKDWIQIPLSVFYSLAIDLGMSLLVNFGLARYAEKMAFLLVGCILRAIGVAMQVLANEAMLAGEAFMVAVARKTKKDFSLVKLFTDGLLVIIAVISSFALLGRLDGIREGTLICVLITAPISKFFMQRLEPVLAFWLRGVPTKSLENTENASSDSFVITISSQSGSGGHQIGRLLSKMLQIPLFDQDVADLIAKEGEMEPEFVKSHLDRIYTNRFWEFYADNYNYVGMNFDGYEPLYEAQTKVVEHLADQGSCIIFGHCSEFVLRNNPNVFSIYLHANAEAKLQFIKKEYHVDSEEALEIMHRHDLDRARYFKRFTGEEWTSSDRFSLSLDTSLLGIEASAQAIEKIILQWKRQR